MWILMLAMGLGAPGYVIRVHDRKLPAITLPPIASPGGDMDGFALRVGSALHAYSRQSGYEACAMICRSADGGLSAQPLSVQAHAFCPLTALCPPGSVPTGVGIHSHLSGTAFQSNPVDLVVLDISSHRGERVKLADPDVFSELDFAGGPGYMAGSRPVWFQAGRRHVRQVGLLGP